MKPYFLLILIIFSHHTYAFQKQDSIPLNAKDVLALNSFSDRVPIALSPDERYLAYTSVNKKKRGSNEYFDKQGVPRSQRNSSVYVVDQLTNKTRSLVDSSFVSWGPSWSPNGNFLAFYANLDGSCKVWLWDINKDSIKKVAEDQVRPFWGFEQIQWSPDGKNILVKLVPKDIPFKQLKSLYPDRSANSNKEVSTSVRKYDSYTKVKKISRNKALITDYDKIPSFLNVQFGDLALIDIKTGHAKRVARKVRAMGYRFSNDGKKIAYSTRQPNGSNGVLVYGQYDLWTIDIAKNITENTASKINQNYGLGFSWSPDDKMLAYTSNRDIHIINTKNNKKLRVFSNEKLNLSHDYRPPLWKGNKHLMVIARNNLYQLSLKNGKTSLFTESDEDKMIGFIMEANTQNIKDDRIAIVTMNRSNKRMGFKFINTKNRNVYQKYLDNTSIYTGTYYSSSTKKNIYFIAQSASKPGDIWRVDYQFKNVKKITRNNPNTLKLKLGKSILIDWKMENGKTLQGSLLLPSNYTSMTKYPLVVKVYGGSMLSNAVNRFGLQGGIDNLQLLATRGYAVLLVDAPTSKGTPMKNIADAVYFGAMRAVELGYADPKRLAVFGHSYGGYSAISAIVKYPVFKTAICSGGFSNLFSHYTKMRTSGSAIGINWSEKSQGKMMGHPWEYFDQYKENSPFFYLDKVTSSTLILHGGADPTVLPSEAEELFVGLRRLGKKSKLLIFEGQGHHPGSWNSTSAIQYWDEIFKWLKEEL